MLYYLNGFVYTTITFRWLGKTETKGKIEHVLAPQIIESWKTTILCHAQDYLFFIFIFVPFGRGFALDLSKAFASFLHVSRERLF